MPITFTKEEIREFLNEQGFEVDDEHMLKKFIRDFKKLIKHEEMKRRRRRLGHFPDETVLDSTDGRQGQTTSTSAQESSSFGEGQENDFVNEMQQTYKSPTPVPTTPAKSYRQPHTSRPREPTSPARNASKTWSSPVHQGRQERPGPGDTQSYGTDGTTSSFENEYSVDKLRQPPPPPKQSKTGIQESFGKAEGVTAAKKQGNRLIMKRVTASQAANGDSVIEESDIDLGPKKATNKNLGRPLSARQPRPQTAPISKRGQSEKQSQQHPMPQTARFQPDKEHGEYGYPEPDELFHALNELIFPDDQGNSQDSLFTESDRSRALLKPPPHVARDPVLLYHWYKTYNWDIYTIPGEDRHMKLRWNVRAKTVGGFHPCIEARNFYKPKSYCC